MSILPPCSYPSFGNLKCICENIVSLICHMQLRPRRVGGIVYSDPITLDERPAPSDSNVIKHKNKRPKYPARIEQKRGRLRKTSVGAKAICVYAKFPSQEMRHNATQHDLEAMRSETKTGKIAYANRGKNTHAYDGA